MKLGDENSTVPFALGDVSKCLFEVTVVVKRSRRLNTIATILEKCFLEAIFFFYFFYILLTIFVHFKSYYMSSIYSPIIEDGLVRKMVLIKCMRRGTVATIYFVLHPFILKYTMIIKIVMWQIFIFNNLCSFVIKGCMDWVAKYYSYPIFLNNFKYNKIYGALLLLISLHCY